MLLLVPSVPVCLCAKVTLVQIFLMRQSATCRLLTLLVLSSIVPIPARNPPESTEIPECQRSKPFCTCLLAVKFCEISAKTKTSCPGSMEDSNPQNLSASLSLWPRHNSNCWPTHNLSHAKLINDFGQEMHLRFWARKTVAADFGLKLAESVLWLSGWVVFRAVWVF